MGKGWLGGGFSFVAVCLGRDTTPVRTGDDMGHGMMGHGTWALLGELQ